MQQQETWDQLYHRKRMEQREIRGARVKHAQLRQEIADLAIAYCRAEEINIYWKMHDKVAELSTLELEHPELKEATS